MKTVIYLLFVLVALVACQSHTTQNFPSESHFKTAGVANVEFSDAVATDKNFFFSTVGGTKFVMMDCQTAQDMNDMLLQKAHATISEIGIANAFFLDGELCTARHATKGLESFSKNIGNDITIIDYATMLRSGSNYTIPLVVGYLKDTFAVNDSVFVRGYFSNELGKVQQVTIAGIGTEDFIDDYKDQVSPTNFEYIQDRCIVMKMSDNIPLGGLSGSPAFNKQGKVIGVYSGRTVEELANGQKGYYARISLFK